MRVPAELPMLDVYMPMMKAAAIIAAGRLGLFEALGDRTLAPAELGEMLGAGEREIAALADFLVTQGYLARRGERFANTAWTLRWFAPTSALDYGSGLIWSGEAWDLISGLADCVRHGGPETNLWQKMARRPQMGTDFSRYMHAFARHLTADLLELVPVPANASRILDLGGSHGLHSISFCERHPELDAVILDLETALTFTSDLIASRNLSGRITLLPGDLLHADWGSGYDIVFYLSVAHNQTEEANRQIIRRIHEALRPGGILVIHEYLADPPLPAYYAAFQLTLLTETATRLFGSAEIEEWLHDGGFEQWRRCDLDPADKGSLILANKKSG